MSWIDVAWPAMGAASATLGLIHLSISLRHRADRAPLACAVAAFGIAVVAAFELQAMHAATPAAYGETLRNAHAAVALFVLGLVAVVQLRFPAGRLWLAALAVALRLATMVVNFASDRANINFARIDSLLQVDLFGAPVSVGIGPANPYVILAQVANLVLLAYFVDTWIRAHRGADAGQRRRIATLIGSIVVFTLLSAGWTALVTWGVVVAPTQIVSTFVFVIAAMSYDLGTDVLERTGLASNLERSQARAAEGERQMELAASAADLAYWCWDIRTDCVTTSERGAHLFGVPLVSQMPAFFERVHEEDRARVRRALDEAMAPGNNYHCEFRVRGDDDMTRWVVSRGRAERDASGEPHAMRGLSLDISARRASEERMREIEREMAQQRETLAHLSRVAIFSELSGSLAHELNQPLAAIMNNAQAALRYLDRDSVDLVEVREILEDIVANDIRAGEVIRRLRAMLRKEEARFVPLDLNAVVADAMRLVRTDLLNRQVSVTSHLADDLPTISGDAVQLQQVLINLVTNGCDAMAELESGRMLTVSTTADDRTVEVAVSDAGHGIPPEDLERVFEPFVSTKRDGMGLGLGVCRTIVHAHGGKLWATRNEGPGVTFHCSLPVREAPRTA